MRDGDFPTAWAVNDAVLRTADPATRDDAARPYHERWVWDGRPLDGRDVLVRCYHGLGDTLQFWRYLAPLRARAASVTVEVQPELVALLRDDRMPKRIPPYAVGGMKLSPFQPSRPTPSRWDVEIMELGHALRLPPPPPIVLDVEPWPIEAPGLLIGVCWAAGGGDAGRSMPLRLLLPLAAHGTLVSLQRGPAAACAGLLDPTGGSLDILDTARMIRALDLVVTVDTMVAHLAAAVGTPTMVLLQAQADWRWGRATSPWYRAHRLFRQPQPGDWDGAVRALLTQLSFKGTLARVQGL